MASLLLYLYCLIHPAYTLATDYVWQANQWWEQAALADYRHCQVVGEDWLGSLEYQRGVAFYEQMTFHLPRKILTHDELILAALIAYHEGNAHQHGDALDQMLAWVVFNRLTVISQRYQLTGDSLYDAMLRQGWYGTLIWIGGSDSAALNAMHRDWLKQPAYRAVWHNIRQAARDYADGKPDPVNGAIEAEPDPTFVVSTLSPTGWQLNPQLLVRGWLLFTRRVQAYFANTSLRGVVNYLMMNGTFLRIEPSGAMTLVNWRFVYPDNGEVLGEN